MGGPAAERGTPRTTRIVSAAGPGLLRRLSHPAGPETRRSFAHSERMGAVSWILVVEGVPEFGWVLEMQVEASVPMWNEACLWFYRESWMFVKGTARVLEQGILLHFEIWHSTPFLRSHC